MWFYCFYSTSTTVLSLDWMAEEKTRHMHYMSDVNNTVSCILSSNFLIKLCLKTHNIKVSRWGWLICCVKLNQMFGSFSLIRSVQQKLGSCGLVWKLWFNLNSLSLSYFFLSLVWVWEFVVVLLPSKVMMFRLSLNEIWLNGEMLIDNYMYMDWLSFMQVHFLTYFEIQMSLSQAKLCFHLWVWLINGSQWFPAVSSR